MPSGPADDRPADPPEDRISACGHPTANAHARSYARGACTVVVVSGEIDLATAECVAVHLQAATAGSAPDVVVDLRPVAFFDCSGLRVLCRAEYRAREHGGRLRIVSDQPRIHRLLRAAGLLKRFPPLAQPPPMERPEG
ncbi:anti-anti-sigma regulatory factor, SpoIIAA [Actinobacteria bacterium OK074]|nr:anti-anti-sigma regulatory factor, SpoIIAA [Actinobacteria bacterium OK074]